MRFDKLKNFKYGWVVGDFEPCLFHTKENDIGVIFCKCGETSDKHFHKNHVEYNIILDGGAIVDGVNLSRGDIFIYEPYDRSDVCFTQDTILLVIKNPSTKNDKYYDINIT